MKCKVGGPNQKKLSELWNARYAARTKKNSANYEMQGRRPEQKINPQIMKCKVGGPNQKKTPQIMKCKVGGPNPKKLCELWKTR